MSKHTTRRIEDSTPFHAGTDWKMAALSIAAAVAVAWWFELPRDFDVNAPTFNPMVFVPVVLVLYGTVQAGKFVRGRAVASRFGASVFEMQGNQVQRGGTLRGRVTTSRNLNAASGFSLRLRCIETVRYAGSAGSARDKEKDVIRWEAEQNVQSSESNSTRIPVEFAIPKHPGDSESGGRVRWALEVEATVDGERYEALFGVPVASAPGA